MLTPKDMAQLLAEYRLKVHSREFYPGKDRVADVYRLFIDRLSPVLQRRFSELDFIPGSFTAEEARLLLDYPTKAVVKDQVLVHELRRHFITYDPANRRFNIQRILRECLKTFFALRHIPESRKRFFQTFTEVMTSISRRYTSQEYASALADFAFEQPNLQKLLLEKRTRHRTLTRSLFGWQLSPQSLLSNISQETRRISTVNVIVQQTDTAKKWTKLL
ncbi:hypothetical protein DPMN_065749 [Dreissena polymorpha]|uniref:Uncharacterized protein n=2 Tax=Dreissena polymorpha TaxID=45954 RepID=A0A9D3YSR2_DREPO|nr:hypothetical protein DPMN_065749 [Dreissena polymorpha]